jgi:hypothetical protein
MSELTHEELLYASEEDLAFYREATIGLPTREGFKGNFLDKDNIEIPFGSQAHILKHFRQTLEITNAHRVLEIGFNCGHGAAMLLKLGVDRLTSIDISEKWETKYASMLLALKYPYPKFSYSIRWNMAKPYAYYELAFIDGAHDEESVFEDIVMCQEMKIPYLLFDDWYTRYGETQKAVQQFNELELVKDMNNLRLYKITYQ